MKTNSGFKLKLNFHIKDVNIDVQKRNLALYKTSIVVIFTFIVTFSPIFAYMSIFYNNINLDLYAKYYSVIAEHFVLPSRTLMIGMIWTAFGLMIFALVFIFFFKPLITMDGMSKNRQLFVVIGIVLLMVIVLLLAALSQFYYAQYETFFRYESMTEGDNKEEWIKELSRQFTENSKRGIGVYHWQNTSVVWWILFYQLAVVFGLAVYLQNSVFSRNELLGIEQYINYSIKKQGVNDSSWTRRVGKLFKVSDKNLSIWLLIITFIIVAPNFAYSILISVKGTNINSLISWSYQVNNLLQDYQGVNSAGGVADIYHQIMANNRMQRSSYFLLNSMPIIIVGITFATTFFFISIMIRGQRNNPTIFGLQYVAMVIEVLFLMSYFLYVKLSVESLLLIWSDPNSANGVSYLTAVKTLVGTDDYNQIIQLFPTGNVINGQERQIEWWSSFEIVSEAIIGFSFTLTTFLGIGLGMLKSNKITHAFLEEKKQAMTNPLMNREN